MEETQLALLLTSLLTGTVRLAVPILLPAIGATFAQRSGILNLGLEGIMMVGASGGLIVAFESGSLWLGLFAALILGIFMNLVMAFWSITLRANQVIAGFALTILGAGLSVTLYRLVFGIRSIPARIDPLGDWAIPWLSELPIIGRGLFQQSPLAYLAYGLVPLVSIVMYRTPFGLWVRAVGENPEAADTRGISVFATRYKCLIIDGAMAGLGGAFLSLAGQGMFVPGMTAGRGYIALSVVILARWKPLNLIWASMLFGGAYALQIRLQTLYTGVNYAFFLMLPYALALVVLLGVSRRATGPAALTVPYSREHDE